MSEPKVLYQFRSRNSMLMHWSQWRDLHHVPNRMTLNVNHAVFTFIDGSMAEYRKFNDQAEKD